jgi:hypothetical protein
MHLLILLFIGFWFFTHFDNNDNSLPKTFEELDL